jgi:uncharacterized protein YjbI with pentapeptide repeats
MEAKRSWWKKAMKPLGVFGIIVVCILIIALLAVIVMVYVFNVNVPGLRGKTLWDWLQLLIVPLALAIIALFFQRTNSRSDQQIALDKQREDLLQAYLDRMSELLLKEKLRSSEVDAEVRNVARVRTITVLTQLDARRIGYVITFLNEAKLMSPTFNDNAVSLGSADFHSINWTHANLSHANLSHASLSHASLTYASLTYANLSLTELSNANLSHANLYHADLSNANLYHADLSNASLGKANLSETNLAGADLSQANLTIANLSQANLYQADLSNANLTGAIGTTPEQLAKAKSLKGATMPDGSKHP